MRILAVLAALAVLLPAAPLASAQVADPGAAPKQARPLPRPATVRPAERIVAPPARPAPTPAAPDTGLVVTVVRSAEPGCEPTCFEWIAAEGSIDQRAPVRLKRALSRIGKRKLPIVIDSPGGTVDDAIALGKLVRQRQLDVIVGRTELVTCAPDDAPCRALQRRGVRLGRPSVEVAKCASSCPFILAGGVRRAVGVGAVVGVHQAATYRVMTRVERTYRVVPRYQWGFRVGTTRQLVAERPISRTVTPTETSQRTYDRIQAHFVAMGVSRDVMKPMIETPNARMRWLTGEEARGYNLVTDRLTAREYAARYAALSAAAAGPGPAAAPVPGASVSGASPPLPTRRPRARIGPPLGATAVP
jgi:hypothetical protein